jgi:type VI secretion system protein ImpC
VGERLWLAPVRRFACLSGMASSSSGGRGLSFSIGGIAPQGERLRPRPPDDVLEILVIADCSGRAARGVREPLAGRRAQPIDVDLLEPVTKSWHASVPTSLLDAAGEPFWLTPASLDDLHPDRLLETAAPLAELAELRARLERDAGAASRLSALLEAARSSGEGGPSPARAGLADTPSPAVSTPAAAADAEPRAGESGGDLLARLLGGSSAAAAPPRGAAPGTAATHPPPPGKVPAKVDIDRFIRAIVGGAGAPSSSSEASSPTGPSRAELAALAAAADAELARRLRAVLAAPAVRALEATWRGIDGLCRHNPDEERVRVSVLDASFEELAANPGELGRRFGDAAPAVLVVDHVFGGQPEPLRALAALLAACREHDVLLLAGAHPHLAGCEHFSELCQPEENAVELSEEAGAAWAEVLAARAAGGRLGLALPRFLLRQPYGAEGEPIERFPFEEILDPAEHEAFSWGNGAYLLARALGNIHADERAEHPDGSIDVRDLPIVYLAGDASGNGESRIKPNAEAWLSERSLGRLRAAGFSVLFGRRETDRVRVYP